MKRTSLKNSVSICFMLLSLLAAAAPVAAKMDIAQTLSDGAQRNTIAFDGFAFITGTFEAQSFFPPGKVADYWGFQYLRDNTADGNGHNTSFLTNCAYNILYILDADQFAMLKTLATNQVDQINLYGYKRFPMMKAFHRQLDGDIPAGSTGLSIEAVKAVSADLYKLDGQISFDRAVVYATLFKTMTASQKSHLEAMKTGGFDSWTMTTQMETTVRELMKGVSQDVSVALMTYAGDLFSWYAGSIEADVYFCPERQGTYYGSFYVKDAPAIGHEGYKIDEALTADAGQYFLDQLAPTHLDTQVTDLVEKQRNNLYQGAENIVQIRTDISTLLRSLISVSILSDSVKAQVLAQVLEKSAIYGELDGEIVYAYTMAFSEIYPKMTTDQKANLTAMRKKIMSGTYNGVPFDYSVCTTPFLYSAVIENTSVLDPYISNTDYLFGVSGNKSCTATLDDDLKLHIPYLSLVDVTSGNRSFDVDLEWVLNSSNPKAIIFKVIHAGVIDDASFSCAPSTLSADMKIHIPDLIFPDGITHYWVDMENASKLFSDGNTYFMVSSYGKISNGSFSLTSDVGVDGGTLPISYTCDSAGDSPALFWSNPPDGTKSFVLLMTTLPGDGTTLWNWVLHSIPAGTTSLPKNSSGIGISGMSSHGTLAYAPPCSNGPGAKVYTFTVYALSEFPKLPDTAEQITGEVLTEAISKITIGTASLNLSYTRPF